VSWITEVPDPPAGRHERSWRYRQGVLSVRLVWAAALGVVLLLLAVSVASSGDGWTGLGLAAAGTFLIGFAAAVQWARARRRALMAPTGSREQRLWVTGIGATVTAACAAVAVHGVVTGSTEGVALGALTALVLGAVTLVVSRPRPGDLARERLDPPPPGAPRTDGGRT
jgi:peptidoglycan/LPS O-acetylase OafA/YrhL